MFKFKKNEGGEAMLPLVSNIAPNSSAVTAPLGDPQEAIESPESVWLCT